MSRTIVLIALLASACGRIGFEQRTDAQAIGDGPAPGMNAVACPAMPLGSQTQRVTTIGELQAALGSAAAGTTILLADGTYTTTTSLSIGHSIVLRSESGDASKVIIDGANTATPLIRISVSNVSLISLTIVNAPDDGVIVEPSSTMTDLTGTLIYDVTARDVAGGAFRLNSRASAGAGPFSDNGTIACSRVTTSGNTAGCSMTTSGWGVDAAAVRGWTVRNNVFDHRQCTDPSFRTIWFDAGSRDIAIVGNVLLSTNLGIMLGGSSPIRTYTDPTPTTCGGTPDLISATVCNNVIASPSPPPVAGGADFEEGIALWDACEAWVMHNTIVTPAAAETFTDLEYRFTGSYVHLVNNLLHFAPLQRDSGVEDSAFSGSDVLYSSAAIFQDVPSGDLSIRAGATLGPARSIAATGMCETDINGKMRDLGAPTPGAFER